MLVGRESAASWRVLFFFLNDLPARSFTNLGLGPVDVEVELAGVDPLLRRDGQPGVFHWGCLWEKEERKGQVNGAIVIIVGRRVRLTPKPPDQLADPTINTHNSQPPMITYHPPTTPHAKQGHARDTHHRSCGGCAPTDQRFCPGAATPSTSSFLPERYTMVMATFALLVIFWGFVVGWWVVIVD